jgi:hypothetical protein
MFKKFPAALILSWLLAVSVGAQGHAAGVKRVEAVTADGIIFTVWVGRQEIKSGDAVVVNYKVKNRSGRAIYLVRDNTSDVVFEGDESIIFPKPLVSLGGHEPCDYNFIRVARGKSYQSHFKVSADKYPKDALHAEHAWDVRVGFGYVLDIRGLRVEEFDDPAPCKMLLDSRLKTLTLGSLSVNMTPH